VPHPSTGEAVSERFVVDDNRCFAFIGRSVLADIEHKIEEARKHQRTKINIIGTKEFGKSHVIAALVARMMQVYLMHVNPDGHQKSPSAGTLGDAIRRAVLFLPKAGDLCDSRGAYLRDSMLMAFGGDDTQLREIANLGTDVDVLLAWLRNSVDFDLVIDQYNDLKETERPTERSRQIKGCELVEALENIAHARGCLVIKGFSANNDISLYMETKEKNSLCIPCYGGMSDEVQLLPLMLCNCE
jgi:hypothetical protein